MHALTWTEFFVFCDVIEVDLFWFAFLKDAGIDVDEEVYFILPATDSEYAKYCDEVGWDIEPEIADIEETFSY